MGVGAGDIKGALVLTQSAATLSIIGQLTSLTLGEGSRGICWAKRTLEIWDDMGVAREAIDTGLWLAGLRLMIADAPARET